jgi:hypothetical protein
MDKRIHLGDGVYAEWDGGGLWLTKMRIRGGEYRIFVPGPQMMARLQDFVTAWQREEEADHA